jgi:hypothetical protein
MMNLREFVAATLADIAAGVNDAKSTLKELGGEANPVIYHKTSPAEKKITDVEFEVSLADNSASTTGKGVGVLLSVVSVGANKILDTELKSMTRVKFSVPVELP